MGITMRDIIVPILDKWFEKSKLLVDKMTTTKEIVLDISDVSPLDLPKFMEENNVPKEVYFSTTYKGEDDDNTPSPTISWEIQVPLSAKDYDMRLRHTFAVRTYGEICKALKGLGKSRMDYVVIVRNTNKFLEQHKTYNDTYTKCVEIDFYQLYLDGDIDKIIEYYLLIYK